MEDHKVENREEGEPFFPHHLLKELAVVYLVLGVVLTLAILVPFSLHEKADPLVTPEPEEIRPPWYFLPILGVIRYMPEFVGILACLLGAFLLFIWPFLDRRPERHPVRRPVSTAIGVVVLLGVIVLGILATFYKTI